MAVAVQMISVIIRRQKIEEQYVGGWEGFLRDHPSQLMCADRELVSASFMGPLDVESFVTGLEAKGLEFLREGKGIDIAVFDEFFGPATSCDWAELAFVSWSNDREITISFCPQINTSINNVVSPSSVPMSSLEEFRLESDDAIVGSTYDLSQGEVVTFKSMFKFWE